MIFLPEKTIVTGGTGMIGSQFENALVLSRKTGCDLRDFNQTMEHFVNIKPEYVIHLAARVGGVLENSKYPGEFFYDNIMINTNVLEASRIIGVKKIVSFLSTCIFPDNIEYPLTENTIHDGPPPKTNYAYAYSKRMLEIQSRTYREQYGINCICIIPANVYGPMDNFNLESGHVIPSLIYKCYLAKKENKNFEIWGSGNPLREFVFSGDIAQLTKIILLEYNENDPINLTNSEEISIRKIAEIIANCMEFEGKIIYDETKPEGQFRKPSSNEKLKKYWPDFKFTSLEDGIQFTCKWFLKNYPNIRK